jgi:hypothetical protein
VYHVNLYGWVVDKLKAADLSCSIHRTAGSCNAAIIAKDDYTFCSFFQRRGVDILVGSYCLHFSTPNSVHQCIQVSL